MKSAVVYYSYSGNTHRIAQMICDILREKGQEVVPVRIRPLKEETSFFIQCRDAVLGKKPEIYRTLLDLTGFDRVILGSPVWAFKPVPAINAYLASCSTLDGTSAVCFVTYGSGTGKEKALSVMEKGLRGKGANVVAKISFQQDESPDASREKLSKVL
jgi:flavodoxin